ncbi:MAG: hypothetical protein HDQ88_03790 [Clostridia bacterium]|nr:hypothetical protein [Clostridia bacterium]
MKRAIDVVTDIHVKAEIERLKSDVKKKCEQIAKLSGEDVLFEEPRFYKRNGNKIVEIQ